MRALIFALISLMVGASTLAKHHEKKPAQEYFVLYDDACDHPSDSCTTKKKPPKIDKVKKFEHIPNYLGTLQTQFSEKNEATIDAWDHYFADKKSCEAAIKKLDELCAQ